MFLSELKEKPVLHYKNVKKSGKIGSKKFTTRVVQNLSDFIQDFFRFFKNGQKKCPFFDFIKYFAQKHKFVTIKIFMVSSLKKVFQICYDKIFLFFKKRI